MNKELKELLATGPVIVEFTKRDGSHRKMLCTTQGDDIPIVSAGKAATRPGLVTVWDIENEGYRSFYQDSIIKYYKPSYMDVQ